MDNACRMHILETTLFGSRGGGGGEESHVSDNSHRVRVNCKGKGQDSANIPKSGKGSIE